MVLRALILAALAVGAVGWSAGDKPQPSRSLGVYWDGRLVNGVRLPADGRTFFTWDPVLKRTPNRAWRRVGSDRLLRVVLRVLDEFAAAHPEAPRVGIGDLSRPHGGDFGPRFGGLGHASHQNGLDADILYPRRDGRELAARRVAQVDRELAQDLVDRFVRAGARRVFVGPNVGVRGTSPVVQRLPHHDDHLHVRLSLTPTRRWVNVVAGHAVELPAGWRARVGAADGSTHISSDAGRIRLRDEGVLWRTDARRRGAPLEATPAPLFRVGRHVFQAWLALRPRAGEREREQTIALLESVRLAAPVGAPRNLRSVRTLGRSRQRRPIRAFRVGSPGAPNRLLVVGCIHGNECAGMGITQRLVNLARAVPLDLWVVQNVNPDGLAARTRGNAAGVDLNRDFDTFSQPETRIARRLIRTIRPDATIWFHQPQALVRGWGASRTAARRYAALAGEPYRSLRWPPGAASEWQNGLGLTSFVVELPPGPLDPRRAGRHVRAILQLPK